MIIMLEGPDLAGKSTLATMLRRRIRNSHIVHRGPPIEGWREEYLVPLMDMRFRSGAYILDRWHLGETIYGPIFRGKSMLGDEEIADIEARCDKYGVTRVLLLPSLETLHTRHKIRGDEMVTIEQVEKILDAYESMINDKRFHIDFVGRTPPTESVVAWLIASAAKKAEESGWTD